MSDVLSATLRAAYAFKIVPDDFIEPVTVQILPRLRWLHRCYRQLFNMAGPAGFEPAHAGIKTQCLTAWRRPNKSVLSESCLSPAGLSRASCPRSFGLLPAVATLNCSRQFSRTCACWDQNPVPYPLRISEARRPNKSVLSFGLLLAVATLNCSRQFSRTCACWDQNPVPYPLRISETRRPNKLVLSAKSRFQ